MALTDKLTAIANAIRAKTGKTAKMTMAEMATEITNIPQASTDAENALVDGTISGEYSNDTVTSIGNYAFHCRKQLTAVSFQKVTSIGLDAFYDCVSLSTAKFPAANTIYAYAFENCSALKSLVLGDTSKVCSLYDTRAFNGSAIKSGTGYIYVPDALVDSYKAATNWSTYADQIKPLSEYTGG